jgi:signal transduction histidine kinase
MHIIAYLHFNGNDRSFNLPLQWTVDFNLLLSLSAVFTLIIYAFHKNRTVLLLFFIFRIILFLIIGIPFGSLLDIEYILLFSFLIDMNLFAKYPLNLISSVVVLILSLFLQIPMSIYNIQREAPNLISMLTYGILGGAAATILIILRKLLDDLIRCNTQIEGMNGLVTRLIGANKGYLEYASKIKNESTKNERSRIIQELHDIIGKSFTNIFAMMDASLKHPPKGTQEHEEIFTWAREQAQLGLDETRVVLYRMREMKETDTSGIKAILTLVKTFQQATRAEVNISWGNLPTYIHPETDLLIYNIVQEALVNAYRHGHATQVSILFWMTSRELLLTIKDNGMGSNSKKKGIGQDTMEKRIIEIKGSITFKQTKEGYMVQARIPQERIVKNEKTENSYS